MAHAHELIPRVVDRDAMLPGIGRVELSVARDDVVAHFHKAPLGEGGITRRFVRGVSAQLGDAELRQLDPGPRLGERLCGLQNAEMHQHP